MPDLLPRRHDDIGLARESAAAGVGAVVHRHHFCPTVDRARIASDATGFTMLGAVLLNDSVGGINPTAVELALQLGGCWIGMPTLSALGFREKGGARASTPFPGPLGFGPGRIRATADDGTLLPEAEEVVRLAAEADVALNVGYLRTDEQLAVARAAAGRGLAKIVYTNPTTLPEADVDAFLAVPGVFFEITSYGIHPEGLGRGRPFEPAVERNVAFIRRVGIDRVVIASDGGMSEAPPPAEILGWALARYLEAGLSTGELLRMTHDNPRRLVPAPPG